MLRLLVPGEREFYGLAVPGNAFGVRRETINVNGTKIVRKACSVNKRRQHPMRRGPWDGAVKSNPDMDSPIA